MNWLAQIQEWLAALENDPDRLRPVFVALLALLGFTFSLAMAMFLRAIFDPVKKRIGSVQEIEVAEGTERRKYGFLQLIGIFVAPKSEDKKATQIQRLETAGYRAPQAFTIFFGIKLLSFVVVPLLLMVGMVFFGNLNVLDWLSFIILSGVIAFLAPDLWLSRKIRQRQKHLRHALPDALDMMVVCTEAGLGLNAAIQRVADEIGVQHPELADEFTMVMLQTRAGMDSRSALKELQRRTGLDDIRAFVTTLLQAMRFGTSVAESLRVFSEDMRDKRLQRAQEIAARLSLTMLMPIATCMLPMFLLIALGPALLVLTRISTTIGR